MVFRIQANLRVASAADRTAGAATIASAISGRNTTVIRNLQTTRAGVPMISWEAEEADTGDAGIIYALIQAMTSPLAGSTVYHHTCRHAEGEGFCIPTAQKVW
jgi:hypothetical protein